MRTAVTASRRTRRSTFGEYKLKVVTRTENVAHIRLLFGETFEEWNRAAGKGELPERIHRKATAKPKRKVKSKRAQKPKAPAAKKGRQSVRKRG